MLYLEFTVLVFVMTHDFEYPGSGSGIQFGQNSSAPQDFALVGRQNLSSSEFDLGSLRDALRIRLRDFWREQCSVEEL